MTGLALQKDDSFVLPVFIKFSTLCGPEYGAPRQETGDVPRKTQHLV
jgi:hypothetical protein